MKLYYFYPESYGDEYFIMSDSLEVAQEKVREHIKEKSKEFPWYDEKYILDVFTRVKITDCNTVIESELC